MSKITLYGAEWCPDCKRSRSLLDSLKVKYSYIDIDNVKGASEEVARLNNGLKSIPTILFEDDSKLVEPSNPELLSKLKEVKII